MDLLHFVHLIIFSVSVIVVVEGAYEDGVCRVDRRTGVGLAEYTEGAVNLRTDYDAPSADECIRRCCAYSDDAGNRCNAVSYYDVDGQYGICQLLDCVPLDSCVWALATNFTAALVLQDSAEDPAVNQSAAAWNQSTVTSQESTISVLATLPPSAAWNSTPSGSLDLQDWNVVDGEEVPSQATVPSADSAAVPGGTVSNNGTSNGTLSEGQGTALSGTVQDAWNVLGLDLLGNTNFTSGNVTGNELTEDKMVPDVDNDWNVVDTGILSDNEQPTNELDNGQQQQQQPDANPLDEGPKDDWNDGVQGDEDDFWSILDDKFWSDEDAKSQSNEIVAGAEADQNRNDLEQPFSEPEQPFNQPEQPFNQPEQPFNQSEQPFNQPEQPFNQPEQPFNQPEQPFNQSEQPFNQPEQPFNQPEQTVGQPEQPLNEPEQPQQSFDDVRVTEDNRNDWQMGNEETPPHQDDTEEPLVRRILMPSPGIIVGLCAALGVAFLVLIAVCRKVYYGREWPKYKPLRSDYDTRYEPAGSSSALLP